MAERPLWRRVLPLVLRGAWTLFVICTPLLGVWLAASLAAFKNGPLGVVWLMGFLLFPGLPLLWEAIGEVRRRRSSRSGKPRILTWYDRLTLRTLVVNLLFLAVVLSSFPADAFAALATRGDWMLMGSRAPWAERARAVLFATAEGLEWLHEATRDDPYARFRPEEVPVEPDPPPSSEERTWEPLPVEDKPEPTADTPALPGLDDQAWPTPPTLHPLVTQIPPEEETSLEDVARWIAEREERPLHRVKALHDYVADRVAYDVPALSALRMPAQTAERVFEERKGVCAGYARLLVALGEVTGDRIVYVGGDARDMGGDVSGGGHAWNAAEIEGRWYLLDATWNAGIVDGEAFEKRYSTAYLFTPPEVYVHDHLPDRDAWQLLEEPLSRGAFMRQPVLRPSFFALGLRLLEPSRSQVTVGDQAHLVVDNPHQSVITAKLEAEGESVGRCEVTDGARTTIDCAIPGPGTFQVWMYASPERSGTYPFVGQVEVQHR